LKKKGTLVETCKLKVHTITTKYLYLAALLILPNIAMAPGRTIHVPDDQPTIQAGIDAAADGDTVLVQPGVYTENINFNGKNIVVGSLFLATSDTSSITQTVIDGNRIGSVVNISNEEDSTAVLVGFTITNGNAWLSGGGISCEGSAPRLLNLNITGNEAYYFGGGIYCQNAHPRLESLRITDNRSSHEGGGLFCMDSNPRLKNVTISYNKTFYYGGGLACWGSNPPLENVSIFQNSTMDRGGGVSLFDSHPVFHETHRCNILLNHAVDAGNDLYASDTSLVSIVVDTLTVLNPDDAYAYPISLFDLDALHARVVQVAADLYVSPTGSDENSGVTASEPLRTLTFALHKVMTDSLSPGTIRIAKGRYSPTTGEFYPLKMKSYLTLSGTSREGTILDGQGQEDDLFSQNGVLRIDGTSETRIENMTITGGLSISSLSSGGGGIFCSRSVPHLENLLIICNRGSDGGGLYFTESRPYLTQVTVTGNYGHSGGGVFCTATHPVFKRVTVGDNSARTGGGISISSSDGGTLEDVTITKNQAEHSGGGLYCNNSDFDMKNCVINTNTAGWGGGGIYCRRSAPYFERVATTQNKAPHGGGMYCTEARPYLVNATFSMNEASYGGAIQCSDQSHPHLVNCILWNNTPEEVYFYEFSDKNAITLYYSDVQNGREGIAANNNGMVYWMTGNIDGDPLFIAPHNGNFDLSIESPCIDIGVQDTALVYYIWSAPETLFVPPVEYIGRAPNMGAFENEPGCPGGARGDINGDRRMNVLDVVAVVHHINGLLVLRDNEQCRADCNRDERLDIQDVLGIVSVILRTGACGP
jgi:predicted outer membrane repeat protein